tara:strand:+ start:614 stop:1429 length:816 start_codon:yes stop_codon:yes gene_type:complete
LLALAIALALLSAPRTFAQDEPRDLVQASVVSDHGALSPGTTTTLVVRLQIKPEWHVYWLNPGDAGVPTKVELTLPEGLASVGARFPAPQRLEHEDGFVDFAYEGELLVLVPVTLTATPAGEALVGSKVSLGVKVSWLVCKEACIPGQAELALSLPVLAKGAERGAKAPVVEQVRAAQSKHAAPLPKGVSASFSGLKLQLEAPGAEELTWFPLAPEAAGPADLKALVAKGPKLTVPYPSEVRQSKRVKGLLAIRGSKHTTYHWVEVTSPTP